MNLNRVELIGGLVRDPTVREGRGGATFLEVTLAVNGTRFDADEGKQVVSTTFVTVLAFGPTAEIVGEMRRGDEVYVMGELGQREVPIGDGKTEKKTRVYAGWMMPTRQRAHQDRIDAQEVWQ